MIIDLNLSIIIRSDLLRNKGYNEMLEIIEPTAVICFGEPFPEMRGNVVAVDYLSSRKVVRNGR